MPREVGSGRWVLSRANCSEEKVTIDQLPFVVGRDGDCGLHLQSRQVSRHHARFVATTVPQCLFLEDVQSDYGTFVNGVRFAEAVPVGDGDVIRFAEEDWTLESEESASVDRHTLNALSALGV